MGNEQSSLHEPKKLDMQPARSALSRSSSIRSDANALERAQIDGRYITSNRPHSSLLKQQSMPVTMHHHLGVEPYSSGTGGYESPQWGWYINTTPPSPEMYHSSRPTKSRKGSGTSTSDTSEAKGETCSTVNTTGNAYPNPVFQGLQDKHKAAPMGWPSVPL
jgi:hypothetical protein